MRGRGTEEVMGDIWPEKAEGGTFAGKGGDQPGVNKREQLKNDKKQRTIASRYEDATDVTLGLDDVHMLSKNSGMREKES